VENVVPRTFYAFSILIQLYCWLCPTTLASWLLILLLHDWNSMLLPHYCQFLSNVIALPTLTRPLPRHAWHRCLFASTVPGYSYHWHPGRSHLRESHYMAEIVSPPRKDHGYKGYNGGWPSARLLGWSAADWSRPSTTMGTMGTMGGDLQQVVWLIGCWLVSAIHHNGYNGGWPSADVVWLIGCWLKSAIHHNGYNGGWPSARLFGWSAADWSQPATINSISSELKRKLLLRKRMTTIVPQYLHLDLSKKRGVANQEW